jgi:hypothetical protein
MARGSAAAQAARGELVLACCGKKRAADRLARGQSQPPARIVPAPAPPIIRPLKPRMPAGMAGMPMHAAPVSPKVPNSTHTPAVAPAVSGEKQIENLADVEFRYTGSGRLTVTGPITGTIYYFRADDEAIVVDGADAPSLLSIPGLRVVS